MAHAVQARRSTRNRQVAAVLLLVTAAGCSSGTDTGSGGPNDPGNQAIRTERGPFRTDGPGNEPAPGQTVDVGAGTVTRSPSNRLRLATVSSRAGLVTGGDALIDVRIEGDPSAVPRLRLDGRDAGPVPAAVDGRRTLLVRGVQAHSTVSAAVGDDPADSASLDLADHPTTGPLFAGPELQPFVCRTAEAGLGPPADAHCAVATRYRWRYQAVDGTLRDLTDPAQTPADAATATVEGRTVPFIVREEQGVLDRSIYTISVLDPAPPAGGAANGVPAWPGTDWNRRLVYRYGGGCGTSYANGGALAAPATATDLLSRGYAVATSTLNTFQALCNPLVSAEVTAMVREHFIEHYGVPAHVIGDGGSGGAIQQLQIAQNYPGLLDGIVPALPFPDATSISPGVADCGLLDRYRTTPPGQALSAEALAAISGFATFGTCGSWNRTFLGGIDPRDGCDPALAPQVYDPVLRPRGVRCTVQDSNVAVMGRDPATGFARRPLDNVGVEYGREALRRRIITVDQFLDLNEGIGGYDIDGEHQPERTAGDEQVMAAVYRAGAVAGPGPLADVPVILRTPYVDPTGDIHDRFRAFSLRERLHGSPGFDDRTLAIWTESAQGSTLSRLTGDAGPVAEAVAVVDDWLTRAAATPADRPWSERLASSRPDAAVDTCQVGDQVIRGDGVHESGPCPDAYPVHGDPRTAAGAPLRNDILQCTRRPVDDAAVAAHAVPFTDAQRARLARIFTGGLCDWTQPSIGQAAWGGPWQSH